jgi:glycosyltransferase involved in cell wall biosynthesis
MSAAGPGQPVVTLVVTAHHQRYLAEALISVAAQTSDGFDLVGVIDVCGDPGLPEAFAAFLPFIRCRRREQIVISAGTAGRARNAGFAAASTPWVAYLDGDDILRPDAIAQMLRAIAADQADILSSGLVRIAQDGAVTPVPQSLTYRPPRWIYELDPDQVDHATYFNQFLAIRRALWAAYPFEETTNGEDIDFMLHQLLAGRFGKVPLPLYGYRDTPASFSKREFEGADVCTRRYRDGYYATLFQARYGPAVAANFSALPRPAA